MSSRQMICRTTLHLKSCKFLSRVTSFGVFGRGRTLCAVVHVCVHINIIVMMVIFVVGFRDISSNTLTSVEPGTFSIAFHLEEL